MRGSRVQNVVSELRGEKIDIIPWTMDVGRFACSALSPAEVTRIYVDNEMKSLEVIVPDDQLSLAIGKKGQNVRLAAKLTGWNIDIKSESRAAEAAMEEFTDATSQVDEGAGDAEVGEEVQAEAGDSESIDLPIVESDQEPSDGTSPLNKETDSESDETASEVDEEVADEERGQD
jgi:N utilization substance protein A